MRRLLPTILIAAALLIVRSLLFADHAQPSSSATTSTSLASTTSVLVPPVLKEKFTLLPCSRGTTIGLEGCTEHHVLTLDARVNVLRRQVFQLLHDHSAKHDFILAENDWFAYRQAMCASESDVNQGGSLVPVDFAQCVVRLDSQHVTELTMLTSSYQSGG
jgi:uncharacterized protein YecT (DUF1311 family)